MFLAAPVCCTACRRRVPGKRLANNIPSHRPRRCEGWWVVGGLLGTHAPVGVGHPRAAAAAAAKGRPRARVCVCAPRDVDRLHAPAHRDPICSRRVKGFFRKERRRRAKRRMVPSAGGSQNDAVSDAAVSDKIARGHLTRVRRFYFYVSHAPPAAATRRLVVADRRRSSNVEEHLFVFFLL